MAFLAGDPVGECEGCTKPIYSAKGVTVDPQGRKWHPDCRANARRGSTKTETDSSVQAAPKRRGRPPKVVADAAESVT